jgi:hypothetical protein
MRFSSALLVLAVALPGAVHAADLLAHDAITDTKEFKELVLWINTKCKPDAMSDITATHSQGPGPGDKYNVAVTCKSGSGKLGNVTYTEYKYAKGSKNINELNALVANNPGGGVTLLLYRGAVNDNALYYIKLGNN